MCRSPLVGNATLIATVVTPAINYTDTTVEAATWYTYYVKGYNDAGDGTKSRTKLKPR